MITVSVEGQTMVLRRAEYSTIGRSSLRYMGSSVLLKVPRDLQMAIREDCVLRMLQDQSYAPGLICAAGNMLLLQHAGRKLSYTNLPIDYHVQAKRILSDLASRGLQHNDIWKNNTSIPPFEIEILEDNGLLKVVDFGTATLNGSFALCGSKPTLRAQPRANETWVAAGDSSILRVLDALHAGARVMRRLNVSIAAGAILSACTPAEQQKKRSSPFTQVYTCAGMNSSRMRRVWRYCGENRHLHGDTELEVCACVCADRAALSSRHAIMYRPG